MIIFNYTKELFQWLKAKFTQLKEKLRLTRNAPVSQNENNGWTELSEDELEQVKGGISLRTVDMEELEADLGITQPKSWELS